MENRCETRSLNANGDTLSRTRAVFDSRETLCYPHRDAMADAIPHEALTRAVRAAFGDATRVVATTLLAADASSRRYARLTIDGAGAPRTVVAMLLGADRFPLGSDEMRAAVRSTELPFVAVGRYLA
jgi:hypothetical protein